VRKTPSSPIREVKSSCSGEDFGSPPPAMLGKAGGRVIVAYFLIAAVVLDRLWE
jgi:hypothetical protein